jgi:hypothetical protein
MKSKLRNIFLLFSTISLAWANVGLADILFQENFEDSNFAGRGWYDNKSPLLSSVEHITGSTNSLQFHFAKGAVTPDNFAASMRRKFQATDSVYISYYIKHSSSWVGSNVAYHPHMFYFLTNKDGDWTGPSYTYMTAYIEENAGKSLVRIQDGMNIDRSNIGKDLTGITENRSVAGCNGDSDGYGAGECYPNGSDYWNGKQWKSSSVLFGNTQGPYYKNDWHLVEAYIKLNSIVNGKAAKDGIVQYWLDGNPILDHKNVVIRTGKNPDMMFNQILIGPYIGVGSPVDQSMWIDNLVVATTPPGETTPAVIAPPQNLRIVN